MQMLPNLIEFFDCLKLSHSQIQFGHLQDVVATEIKNVPLEQPDNLYFLPGVHPKKTNRASDQDIVIKNWFFVDIDIRKEMKLGDSEEDTQKVMETCKTIAERLEGTKFENYALANFTGNGMHLHFIGDPIKIMPENIEVWKKGYQAILQKLDVITGVPSDKSCGNVGRICRIPGTWNVKNGNTIQGEILALDLERRFAPLQSVLDLGETVISKLQKERDKLLPAVPEKRPDIEEDVYQLILDRVKIEDLVVNHSWSGQRWSTKEEGDRICFYDASGDRKGCFVQKSTNMLINGGTPHFEGNHSPYTFVEKIMGLQGREVFEFFEQFDPMIKMAGEKNRKLLSPASSEKTKPSKVPQRKSVEQVASEVLEKHKLVLDVSSTLFYENIDGIWRKISTARIGAYVDAFDNDQNQTNKRVSDIIGKIGRTKQKIDPRWNIVPTDCVVLQNGILNLTTAELTPISVDHWVNWSIRPEFDAQAKCPTWDKCLEDWFGADPDGDLKRRILQEFMGYVLLNHHNIPKSLFLFGKSQSGKSTIAYVLGELVGENHVANLNIERLSDHRELSKLQDARLNVMSELDGKRVDCGGLKSLTGGDRQMIDPKYRDARSFCFTAKHLLISNNYPLINDPSWATHERLITLPFFYEIINKDPNLKQKLAKEASGILNFAIVGCQRLTAQKGFTEIQNTAHIGKEETLNQNLVISFIRDFCIEKEGSVIPCGTFKKEVENYYGKCPPKKDFGDAYQHLGIKKMQKMVDGVDTPRRCLLNYELKNSPSIVNKRNEESLVED